MSCLRALRALFAPHDDLKGLDLLRHNTRIARAILGLPLDSDDEIDHNESFRRVATAALVSLCHADAIDSDDDDDDDDDDDGDDDGRENGPHQPRLTGAQDVQNVRRALDCLATWWLFPALPDGVGVSIAARTSNGSDKDAPTRLPNALDMNELAECTRVLLACVASTRIREITLDHHLVDIHAAVCTLVFHDKERAEWREALVRLNNSLAPSLVFESLMELSRAPTTAPWLRHMCTTMLSATLQRPGGVASLLMRMLDETTPTLTERDFRAFRDASRHVAQCPRSTPDPAIYYQRIAPQILRMLRTRRSTALGHKVVAGASSIAVAMLQRHPDAAKLHLFQPLWRPFYCFFTPISELEKQQQQQAEQDDGTASDDHVHEVLVDEHAVAACVEDTHRLFVAADPHPALTALIAHLIPCLFRLYCFCRRGRNALQSACLEIIETFLKRTDAPQAYRTLVALAMPFTTSHHMNGANPARLIFSAGDTGGVCVRLVPTTDVATFDFAWTAESVATVVARLKSHRGLAGDLFLHLLQHYMTMRSNADASQSSTAAKEKIKRAEEEGARELNEGDKRMVLQVLIALDDSMGAAVLTNTPHALTFLVNMLEDGLARLTRGPPPSQQQGLSNMASSTTSDDAALQMALGLLAPLLHQSDDNDSSSTSSSLSSSSSSVAANRDPRVLARASVVVSQLAKRHPSDEIRSLCATIALFLAATGCEGDSDEKVATSSSAQGGDGSSQAEEERHFQSAMAQLRDPLLPVRAAGLRSLREIVLVRSGALLRSVSTDKDRLDVLLDVFGTQMAQEDPFVYGSAIMALAALSDVHADRMIAPICAWYTTEQTHYVVESAPQDNDKKASPDCTETYAEYRTRVGEVLFKTALRCGETLPRHLPALLAAFFHGARAGNSAVRASALVNLGAVCELSPWGVRAAGAPIHDVSDCALQLLVSDKIASVRRACVLVLHGLLRGFTTHFVSDEPVLLQRITDTLTRTAERDVDRIVVGHAQETLSLVNEILRVFLTVS